MALVDFLATVLTLLFVVVLLTFGFKRARDLRRGELSALDKWVNRVIFRREGERFQSKEPD